MGKETVINPSELKALIGLLTFLTESQLATRKLLKASGVTNRQYIDALLEAGAEVSKIPGIKQFQEDPGTADPTVLLVRLRGLLNSTDLP